MSNGNGGDSFFKLVAVTVIGTLIAGPIVYAYQDEIRDFLPGATTVSVVGQEGSVGRDRENHGQTEYLPLTSVDSAPPEPGDGTTPKMDVVMPAPETPPLATDGPPVPRGSAVFRAGSEILVRVDRQVCSAGAGRVEFTGSVEFPVAGSDGVEIRSGATVNLEGGPGATDGEAAGWSVLARSVAVDGRFYSIASEAVAIQLDTVPDDRKKILIGAAGEAGGNVHGDDGRSALLGPARLAAAAAPPRAPRKKLCIPRDSRIRVRLTRSLLVDR